MEPFLPNHKIGIIHLASGIKVNDKDMRTEKNLEIELNTLDNNKISTSLRFKTNWKKIKSQKIGLISREEIFMLDNQKLKDIDQELFIN